MRCTYFDTRACVSCSALPVPYRQQLAAKAARVSALLPPLEWLAPYASPPTGFRTSIKLVVSGSSRSPKLGILGSDQTGVDLSRCPITDRRLLAVLPPIKSVIHQANLTPYSVPARRGELKNVLLTVGDDGHVMARFVLRSKQRLPALRHAVADLQTTAPAVRVVSANFLPQHVALPTGPEEILLTEQSTLPMTVGDVRLYAHPGSFVQTNSVVAGSLYRQAAAWLAARAPQSVLDLFCGMGGFALHCAAAGTSRVSGIDVSAASIASARTAAREAGSSAVFSVADLTTLPVNDASAEAVVVNPPRRGIGQLMSDWLATSSADTLLYSSCNPLSLASDLAALPDWIPRRGRVFDMFPHTDHAEVLVELTRK
ncbi:methyltransferase domain-containing protein [Buchananella hordeovulneris]|uniref:Methyltransferase domain-containing protein n=1 Tax=Buchananella hordeovulneris TaxID=52770 RepID=A0A1Q5PVD6_9ACTO|nr:methyltransferase domain-containing protein [Buchananella hordeovulneris]OKL51380.1 hypothetical protein BSZ40_07380 [Buchananella hordeovulneris]